MSNTRINMIGVRQGKLTVIKFAGHNSYNEATWLCRCDCGKEIVVRGYHLRNGQHGCRECSNAAANKAKAKHNLSGTILYNKYMGMLKRCYLKSNPSYPRYGGRGIKVCDTWRDKENGFMRFYKWSINNGYEDGKSLDRINNDGNYSPRNCRWATAKEQANNRSNNRLITFNGETHNLYEWSDKLNIKRVTLEGRLRKGWSVEKTFTTPVRGGGKYAKTETIPETS